MSDIKKYDIFVFLSTFTRSFIEVFIPIILYNKGLSITSIFWFLITSFFISFLLTIPVEYFGKRISLKWLTIISLIFIAIAYYYLLIMPFNRINLLIIIFCHAVNAHVYWITRHYYALEVLPKRNMADEVGNIVIFSQIAVIPATYFGALLIKKFDIMTVLVVVVLMYIISVIPLFLIKQKAKKEENSFKNYYNMIFSIPKRSLWFYVFAQFRIISRYIFPLYIFLNVKSTYEYLGVFNIVVGIASVFFVYFFARKMDRDKKDYLILSGAISAIVWVLKLNILSTLFLLAVALLEGLVERMYETAFNRNLYALGKHYKSLSYGSFVEGFQHLARTIIVIIIFLFIHDIKLALYVCALMMVITGLIGFDDGKGGY